MDDITKFQVLRVLYFSITKELRNNWVTFLKKMCQHAFIT